MCEIEFHFNVQDKKPYLYQLLLRAYQKHFRYAVVTRESDLHALDTFLWTYQATEFLPHCIYTSSIAQLKHSPIVLFSTNCSSISCFTDIPYLIQDTEEPWTCFSSFEKVMEIVSTEEQDKYHAREKWKYYKQKGYPMVAIDLSSKN
ncbi:MAG: DNA polymerase III subunit chi [Gammaproteobacteria bacterium]|nr:DNA polymerase III subunit chi [Gammaproteobacteria bacterium]